VTLRDHIAHALNPLHVYCRARDCGVPKGVAVRCCVTYERTLFRVVRLALASPLFKKPLTWDRR
jgi:hypothetical protein